jgi:CBS domain-containing protein
MFIKQIMSQPVVSCQISDTLNQAAQLMWERDCGVVPVVDERGCAVAMLTDRDICMAAYIQGKPLSELSVRTAMSQELHACGPDDTIEQAEQTMRERQIRRMPVLDPQGQPVGVLSLNDIALASTKQHPGLPGSPNGVSLTSTAKTLAALCAHRVTDAGPKLA